MWATCALMLCRSRLEMDGGGKCLPLADEKLVRGKKSGGGRRNALGLTIFGLLLAVRQFFADGLGRIMLIEVHTAAALSRTRPFIHSPQPLEVLLVLGFLTVTHECIVRFIAADALAGRHVQTHARNQRPSV